MLKNIGLVLFSGLVLFAIIFITNKKDNARMMVYDGCYEQYVSNNIPSEIYIEFMSDCMNYNYKLIK